MSYIEDRIKICERCSIYNIYKLQCSATLWIDPNTGAVASKATPGYIKGCGCYIPTKVKREDNHCPAKKW